MMNLPPPPPPPITIGTPPPLTQPEMRQSMANNRTNLMDEIRNNNVKLNHVTTREGKMNLDITDMNK